MGSTEKYLEQLAAEAERVRREQAAAAAPAPQAQEQPQEAFFPEELPEELKEELGEGSKSAFASSVGKREAFMEAQEDYDEGTGEGTFEDFKSDDRRRKRLTVAVLAAVVAAPLAYLLTLLGATPEAPPVVEPPADPFGSFAVAYSNPLQEALPQASRPLTSKVTTTATLPAVRTSTGATFSLPGTQVETPAQACVVETAGDFCLAGTLTGAEGSFPLYYAKDVVRLPALAEAAEFEVHGKKGVSLLAQTVVVFAGEPTRFLVVVLPDSSGWMLAVDPALPQAALDELVKKLQVKH